MMLCNFLKKYILEDSTVRLCFTKPLSGILCEPYDLSEDMIVYIPVDFNSCFQISEISDKEHWIHQYDRSTVIGITEGLFIDGFPEIHVIIDAHIEEE